MGGGDAISVQAEGREDDRGGTEEGGETVKPGAVGGGAAIAEQRSTGPVGNEQSGVWWFLGGMCDWLIAATSGLSGRKQYSGSG